MERQPPQLSHPSTDSQFIVQGSQLEKKEMIQGFELHNQEAIMKLLCKVIAQFGLVSGYKVNQKTSIISGFHISNGFATKAI